MVSIICRLAAISAGPMSARPRGRRALSLLDFSGLSAIVVLHRSGRLVAAAVRCGKANRHGRASRFEGALAGCPRRARACTFGMRNGETPMALAPRASAIPNDLESFWMPFTANRAFKKAPRLLAGAKDMHYVTTDGRKVLDATAGLWCCNAGHNREPIVAAIQ